MHSASDKQGVPSEPFEPPLLDALLDALLDELLDALLDVVDDAPELLDVDALEDEVSAPPAPAVPLDELDEDSPATWRSGAHEGTITATDKTMR